MTPGRPLTIVLESLDTLAGVLWAPTATMARITDRRPLGLALLAAMSVAIVSGLVLLPNPPELAEDILGLSKGSLRLWTVLPLWVALFAAVLSLQAALVHLEAAVLGARRRCRTPQGGSDTSQTAPATPGEGTGGTPGGGGGTSLGGFRGTSEGGFRGIFCGLCFAYLPGLLAAPLIMLRALLASARANAAYQVVYPLLALWVFFLGVTAVRQNYRMPPWRAAAVCAVAFVVLVVLPIVLGAIIMTQIMGG